MRLEVKKYLYDIEHAAGLIFQFTAAKSLEEFQHNPMLKLAVERALTIIREAFVKLAKLDSVTGDKFSEYQRIIAFRNILIHAYAEVDDRIVRDVIQHKLPALHDQAAALLGKIIIHNENT